MGNQGIATGKCEIVRSGGIERDPGDTSLNGPIATYNA